MSSNVIHCTQSHLKDRLLTVVCITPLRTQHNEQQCRAVSDLKTRISACANKHLPAPPTASLDVGSSTCVGAWRIVVEVPNRIVPIACKGIIRLRPAEERCGCSPPFCFCRCSGYHIFLYFALHVLFMLGAGVVLVALSELAAGITQRVDPKNQVPAVLVALRDEEP